MQRSTNLFLKTGIFSVAGIFIGSLVWFSVILAVGFLTNDGRLLILAGFLGFLFAIFVMVEFYKLTCKEYITYTNIKKQRDGDWQLLKMGFLNNIQDECPVCNTPNSYLKKWDDGLISCEFCYEERKEQ